MFYIPHETAGDFTGRSCILPDMIELDRLTFAYPGAPPVLRDFTLDITDGAHVGLTGSNGSGKTTLALLVKGVLAPSGGRVIVDGIAGDSPDARRAILERVGLVFQNPEDTIVSTTVERELAFGLENMGIPAGEMDRRVDEAIDRFGLAGLRYANPLALSGGEKQRLALAAVMIMQPRHLVLDEPTSLIDPWNRPRILDLVRDAVLGGTTVVHITQSTEELRAADRVIAIDAPEFSGGPYNVPGDCPPDPPRDSRPVLTMADVSFRYDTIGNERPALDGVSLSLPAGTATAVLGPSGAGKTTLLELAAGLVRPSEGSAEPASGAVRAMAFQFPERQLFGETLAEYISFGLRNMGMTMADHPAAVDAALALVGLVPEVFRGRDPLSLSGGEQRRAAFAAVLALRPALLVLDEPTAGLDAGGRALTARLLQDYTACGGTLLFSSHDFDLVCRIAHRAVVLDLGRVETAGTVDAVFASSPLLGSITE